MDLFGHEEVDAHELAKIKALLERQSTDGPVRKGRS